MFPKEIIASLAPLPFPRPALHPQFFPIIDAFLVLVLVLCCFVNSGWVCGQLYSCCGPAALLLMPSKLPLRGASEYSFTDLGGMDS